MSRKTEIQDRIAKLQAQLAIINRTPSDTFHIGTVVVFSSNQNKVHWYYAKTGEEAWLDLKDGTVEKPLADWILNAVESGIGYFEVYDMVPTNLVFASA